MAPLLFRLMLLLIVLYAFFRGGREERLAAGMSLIAAIATTLVLSPLHERFATVEFAVLAIDALLLAGFIAIALGSKRFWPLWVSGLQLTTIFGHLFKLIDANLMSKAYAASLNFWAYPIILILGVATWRGGRWRNGRGETALLR